MSGGAVAALGVSHRLISCRALVWPMPFTRWKSIGCQPGESGDRAGLGDELGGAFQDGVSADAAVQQQGINSTSLRAAAS